MWSIISGSWPPHPKELHFLRTGVTCALLISVFASGAQAVFLVTGSIRGHVASRTQGEFPEANPFLTCEAE